MTTNAISPDGRRSELFSRSLLPWPGSSWLPARVARRAPGSRCRHRGGGNRQARGRATRSVRVPGHSSPGSTWEEFPGVSHASRHFDGNANFDEIIFPTKGFSGLTLRLHNPGTGQWSLYWASKRTGMLFAPVTGAFKDGTGEFFGEDTHDDSPYSSGSAGRISHPARPAGSRPSPPAAARPGSTTGIWTRPDGPEAAPTPASASATGRGCGR
jgi:hypothetical protein